MNQKKTNKRALIACAVIVALIAVFAIIFVAFKPKTTQGAKAITVEVVSQDETTKSYDINTDAEYVRGVMDELADQGFTYAGEDSDYGLYLLTINDETHDWNADGTYWSLYINGDYASYGVDQQPIADGDVVTFKCEQ